MAPATRDAAGPLIEMGETARDVRDISFISPISGKRILSNRRGQRLLCASVQELAAMEAEGDIKPRHSDKAFDNALGVVGKRLEAQRAPTPAPA